MKYVTDFAGQNWLITPVARAVNEAAPSGIGEQKWLLTLSGVAIPDVKGSAFDWFRESLVIQPDLRGPINQAVSRFGIPRPDEAAHHPQFAVEQWAPFAAISSISDLDNVGKAGFAVDVWRPRPFWTGKDANGREVTNLWDGIEVDVAVRDAEARLNRVSYQITLLGRIRFIRIPPIS